jgi:quercetin dioxygenase-like cupin family protein
MLRSLLRSVMPLAVLLTLLGSIAPTVAQDATHPAEQAAGTPEATTFRALAAGSIEVLAPSTANVVLGRVNLAPGTSIPFDPSDPSALLVYMTAGELTFRVEVPMTVARGTSASTPVPTEPEAIAAGTVFTMRDGDSAIFPGAMEGEVRNDGPDEATALVVDIVHLTAETATPTP